MTTIQDEQKCQKIMARMQEHLVPVLKHCRGGLASSCKAPRTTIWIMKVATLIQKLSFSPASQNLF